MKLFLDFDGVLHPTAIDFETDLPCLLDGSRGAFFMWANVLAAEIAKRPDLEIVLSTNWCGHRGVRETIAAMPEALRRRVVGSTLGGADFDHYAESTRFQQISDYLKNWRITDDWIALDDLHEGDELDDWPAAERHRLILTDPQLGLSDPAAVAALRAALEVQK